MCLICVTSELLKMITREIDARYDVSRLICWLTSDLSGDVIHPRGPFGRTVLVKDFKQSTARA